MGGHPNLRVRFYPGEVWRCVVYRLDGDGMPLAPDIVSVTGSSKEGARDAAIGATEDDDVKRMLLQH